jgi:type I restriction enzyme S subunit
MDPFLFMVLPNFARQGNTKDAIKGATLNRDSLTNICLPLPPLAEQHRIVAKVDELMALCDRLEATQAERETRRTRLVASTHASLAAPSTPKYQPSTFFVRHLAHLTSSPTDIPHLRQTILNLAIRGKLVPQDPTDELASTSLGSSRAASPRTVAWALPTGWAWSSLGRIGKTIGGGTPSKSEPSFWRGKIPWVSPKDMKVLLISDAQDHISESALEASAAKLIPAGALLVVVRGMILAHSFPTALTSAPVAINQDMKAIVPFRQDIAKMLLLLIRGLKPQVLQLVEHSTHGTCKLLTEQLFALPLPIPPLAEQHRIVAKVDELMALCDRLEAQLTTTQTQSRRLLESTLHQALATT